jgi:hypothetical protein
VFPRGLNTKVNFPTPLSLFPFWENQTCFTKVNLLNSSQLISGRKIAYIYSNTQLMKTILTIIETLIRQLSNSETSQQKMPALIPVRVITKVNRDHH